MGSDYAALLTNLFLYSNKAGLISLLLKKNNKIQPGPLLLLTKSVLMATTTLIDKKCNY
jgi:hypothetical protein